MIKSTGFSEKQLKVLAFGYSDYDILVCDGAVRSGKSCTIMISFVDWAMRNFTDKIFIIGGRTVSSAVKNIINPFLKLSYTKKKYKTSFTRFDNKLIIQSGGRVNTFYVFGGNNELAQYAVQGLTAAGMLLDECVIMCRSFVEQCVARCSVEGSKLWFTCNPDSPNHWFYNEYVLKAKEKNALYLHFVMRDNPSLSEKMLKRYESLYTGTFYRKYVLGEWCKAEGLVYQIFDENKHTFSSDDTTKNGNFDISCNKYKTFYYLSLDYGITNAFCALLWEVKYNGKQYIASCISEYYYTHKEHNEHKLTDEEHYANLEKLVGNLPLEYIVLDPSANSFKLVIDRHNKYSWKNAKNEVLEGISYATTMLSKGNLVISRDCTHLIREFGLYCWDEEADKDQVIKENDHACDALRYFCYTIFKSEYDNDDDDDID